MSHDMSPQSNRKAALGQWSTSKKHTTLKSSKPEPGIWSHDTGQRISWYDSCQLNIIWISKIYAVIQDCMTSAWLGISWMATKLCDIVARRRCWAHTPVIHAASHFYHDKRVAWVSTSMHACDPLPIVMGLCLAARRELHYKWLTGPDGGYEAKYWPSVKCGLSLLLVLIPAPRVFLRVLEFSSLQSNQHSKF